MKYSHRNQVLVIRCELYKMYPGHINLPVGFIIGNLHYQDTFTINREISSESALTG